MTCIVGIAREGTVFMGADTRVTSSYAQANLTHPKIVQHGDLLFGFSGDMRAFNILEGGVSIPARTEGRSARHYIALDVMSAVRQAFHEHGHLWKEGGREHSCAYLLIGYKGTLYETWGNFCVGEAEGGEAATGSGVSVATGSLHATRHSDLTPEQRIRLALDAASQHAIGVAPPYHLFVQRDDETTEIDMPDAVLVKAAGLRDERDGHDRSAKARKTTSKKPSAAPRRKRTKSSR